MVSLLCCFFFKQKTAYEMRISDWSSDVCSSDLLKDVTLEEGAAAGAKTLILGVANQGGYINEKWVRKLEEALDLGMDIASGLHTRLTSVPGLAEKAEKLGRRLIDVRHPTHEFDVGRGVKRTGKRLLTVGTDTSVGKLFTSLAIEQIGR